MPTIKQLPTATAVSGSDLIPVSQNGLTRGVTVNTLLGNTQPLLSVPQGTLLGRMSSGPGTPEGINVGTGLSLQSGTLVANGTDHVSFTLSTSLLAGDEVVVNSGAAPKRLPATQLRSLFSAGSGIQIDSNGVISASVASGSGGAAGPAGQGFTFRGAWQANTAYSAYDVVTTGGQTYVAPVAIGAASTFAATSWSLLAAQGAVGPAGPAGVTGATGATGATGPAGPTVAASSAAIGGVKPGTGLSVASDGTLSIANVPLGTLNQGSAAVGQLLSWTGTGWAPTTPAAGVSFTATAPISVASGVISLAQSGASTGQVLTWNGTGWTPATPAASVNLTGAAPVSVASGVISLAQSGASTGQVLTWNGTGWSPTTPAASVNLTGAAPISVASGVISLAQSGASSGQVLTWNGTGWVPQLPAASGASVGTALPQADGSASAGTSSNASREDHRHPTDVTRAPLAGPVFTSSITLPVWTTATRPNQPSLATQGFASDTGRLETYTSGGWVQYIKLTDLPAAAGQLLGGTSTGGSATAVSVGAGLQLLNGTLSTTTTANSTISGISIDGSSIVASVSSPYQMATSDRVVDVNKTTGSPTKLLLPSNPTLWVEYTIIDGKGDASANNITVAAASGVTVNGQSTFLMNANNDAVTLRAVSATVWRIV